MKINLIAILIFVFVTSCKLTVDKPAEIKATVDCQKDDMLSQSFIDTALNHSIANDNALSRETYSKIIDAYHKNGLTSGQHLNILALMVIYIEYTSAEFSHLPPSYKGKWDHYVYDGSISIEKYIIQNKAYRFNRHVTLYDEYRRSQLLMLNSAELQAKYLPCDCHLKKLILFDDESYPSLCELEIYQLITEPVGYEKYIRLSIFKEVFLMKNKSYYDLIRWQRRWNKKYFKQYINCISTIGFPFHRFGS